MLTEASRVRPGVETGRYAPVGAVVVGLAFGGVVLSHASGLEGPASWDHKGARYIFRPASGDCAIYALDVERLDVGLDAILDSMLQSISTASSLATWTEIEVVAKLRDQPAHLVLRAALELPRTSLHKLFGINAVQLNHPYLSITVGHL